MTVKIYLDYDPLYRLYLDWRFIQHSLLFLLEEKMKTHTIDAHILKHFQQSQEAISEWLLQYESIYSPIYSSLDIRDTGFKMAVVDTNLFPAGFNNLSETAIKEAASLFRSAILKRVPHAKDILIIIEKHTRNKWYLENARILQKIIHSANFNTHVAAFFDEDDIAQNQIDEKMMFTTSSGSFIKVECADDILKKIQDRTISIDMVFLNNDLSSGIPESLTTLNLPIFPPMCAGWHSRCKSRHFAFANALINEFAKIIGLDPWYFLCLYEKTEDVQINKIEDRQKLYEAAAQLFAQIKAKYKEHHIDEKPYILIKADSGTYGLGVVTIEEAEDILRLNNRAINDLKRNKGGIKTNRFLLQEGIGTIYKIGDCPSELTIYQIDNRPFGGFFRYHRGKGARDNLNSPGGMEFKEIGSNAGIDKLNLYHILARIAGIAAGMEIKELKGQRHLS